MSRRADSVLFGFDFQENAAIILMIENMAEMDFVKVEGEEDVEICLNDGSYILAQVKSVVKASTDFNNVRAKAKEAMASLSEAAGKKRARSIIYYTNSPDPFKDEASKPMFYGKSRVEYNYLPESTKDLINSWLAQIEKPLDTSCLTIKVLPFETDDDEQRYKVVWQEIDDFVGGMELSSTAGLRRKLHDVWLSMLDRNGSKSDASITLKKKEVVWPIIVFVTGRGVLDRNARYCTDLDDGDFNEIEHRYGKLIQDYSERFEFVVKVVADFSEKQLRGRDAIERFINDNWSDYVEELGLSTIEDEVKENLTKIVLYTMLSKRYEINRIKQFAKI